MAMLRSRLGLLRLRARPVLLRSLREQMSSCAGLLTASRPKAGFAIAASGALCLATQSTATQQALNSRATAIMSRVMLPDDANPAGNVHGGTILRMVDEAGYIACTRHANSGSRETLSYGAMARIEQMDFVAPMYVGELATLNAEVTFASEHSCEVLVEVYGENLATGVRRLTNRARVWYVAIDGVAEEQVPRQSAQRFNVAKMPSLALEASEAMDAERRYREQKKTRRRNTKDPSSSDDPPPAANAASLVQLMLPGDLNGAGFVQAGVVLKLMDNAAGICAYRHCRTNVVTAVLDALDFCAPVRGGSVVRVEAQPTFASSRSLEIEVSVRIEAPHGQSESYECAHGFLTFVSLDEKGRPLPLEPLPTPQTPAEVAVREAGKARYEARKRARKQRAEVV